MTLIINPKNKTEEKILKAFLTSLQIGFYSEVEEDKALYKAMQEGRKTKLLNGSEKVAFIKKLKQPR